MQQQCEENGGLLSCLTMGNPVCPGRAGRDGRVCRLLDECLSVRVFREIGLLDVCRKFLEFLKNVVCRDLETGELLQHTYGALGESEVPLEKMPYLAGYFISSQYVVPVTRAMSESSFRTIRICCSCSSSNSSCSDVLEQVG